MKIETQEPAYRVSHHAGDALDNVASTGCGLEDDPDTRGLPLPFAGSDLIVLTDVSIGASTPNLDYNT